MASPTAHSATSAVYVPVEGEQQSGVTNAMAIWCRAFEQCLFMSH
jgi:hypothetical protein